MGEVKRENAFENRLEEYKVYRKKNETKMKKEQLKSLALVQNVKKMDQECDELRIEKDFLHQLVSKDFSNASAERKCGLVFTNRMISSVLIALFAPALRFPKLSFRGIEQSCHKWNMLRFSIQQWNGLSEKERELFGFSWWSPNSADTVI